LALAAKSTVWTVKASILPSGESCGSSIRAIFAKASKVNGAFAERQEKQPVPSKSPHKIAVRMFIIV